MIFQLLETAIGWLIMRDVDVFERGARRLVQGMTFVFNVKDPKSILARCCDSMMFG